MSRLREIPLVLLLLAAPLAALAPAWMADRLLAPGQDGVDALAGRVEVWRALQRGELPSWNPSVFSGTPLLASYRPGALHPAMLALAPLPPLVAFQLLVLGSLALVGPLAYLYLRRLGTVPEAALLGGVGLALGPYTVTRLADTGTLLALAMLLLLLLALEEQLRRPRPLGMLGLGGAAALLVLAGSPEASLAGLLLLPARLAGELLVSGWSRSGGRVAWGPLGLALLAGLLLAAPQWVPTGWALLEAGAPEAGARAAAPLAGMAGLVVRTLSHTPAPIFALAAVPLLPAARGLRTLLAVMVVALLAVGSRGWLEPPGSLALAVEVALAVAGALSLSAQWRTRQEARGRRLRLLALVAALCAAAALSIATTVTGPLDAALAAPVGLLALGLILYFILAGSPRPVAARVFLLPLLGSFLLQPGGRQAWSAAPTRGELEQASGTRAALDREMGELHAERTLTLVDAVPRSALAGDLAWGSRGGFAGRRNVNGDDPLVSGRRRATLEGMRTDGSVSRVLLETDPGRLDLLGVRWVQVPTEALATQGDRDGLGEPLSLVLEPPRPRLFALPYTRATEVRMVSFLAGATAVEQGTIVAECVARLANGREIWLPIRAGIDTAEWAWDRPDVRPVVRHAKPPAYRSAAAREGFLAHEYRGVLKLPGRFAVTSLRLRAWPEAPPLWLLRLGLHDQPTQRSTGVSLTSAYASDEVRWLLAANTPRVSLFQVRHGIGPAWVVQSLRRLPDEARVLDFLRSPTRLGVDARQEALVVAADAGEEPPPGARSGPAQLAKAEGGRLVVRAAGPGVLVLSEGWDAGWTARVDGRPSPVLRVNGDRLGVVIGEGNHRVVLLHRPRGFLAGCLLAAGGVLLLASSAWRARGRAQGSSV